MSILEKFEVIIHSPLETKNLGERIGLLLKGGEIICLTGELGSGKTTLIQGIAKGLSVKEPVNSPSFSLLNIYKGRVQLCHFDLYRMQEGEDIGFDEFFNSSSICVIEWAEKLSKFFPENSYLRIILDHINLNSRRFLFIPRGKYFVELVKNIGF